MTAAVRYHAARAFLPEGWVADVRIEADAAGDIVRVEPGGAVAGAMQLAGAVIPGLPNLHSHAHQRAMAGMSEHRAGGGGGGDGEDSFWTWRQTMHRLVETLSPDDVEAIAAQLYLEMLKAGYTAVCEFHYLHNAPGGAAYDDPAEMAGRIAAAAELTGIGLTMLPVLYARAGYGDAAPNPGQRRFRNDPESVLAVVEAVRARAAGDPQVRVGLAPHSPRQAPAAPLRAALAGLDAVDPTAPVHIHVAEQERDVEMSLAHDGLRPVEWLLENFDVGPRWCLVHATHMTGAETRRLAESGAVAGLCPTTEANLGDGVFPLVDYLAAGGRFGVGSDSHVSVSVVEELRWLEYGQRLLRRRRNLAAAGQGGSTGERLFRTALAGGAQAAGRPLGAIAPGHRCDLVALDAAHPLLDGAGDAQLLDRWLFAGNANLVRDVVVGGRHVVVDGRHAEEARVARRFREVVRRLA